MPNLWILAAAGVILVLAIAAFRCEGVDTSADEEVSDCVAIERQYSDIVNERETELPGLELALFQDISGSTPGNLTPVISLQQLDALIAILLRRGVSSPSGSLTSNPMQPSSASAPILHRGSPRLCMSATR